MHPGGWLLVAFHIDSPDFAAGEVNHLTAWFGQDVELDGYFLEPASVVRDVEAAGFTVTATVVRSPAPGVEYPSLALLPAGPATLTDRIPAGAGEANTLIFRSWVVTWDVFGALPQRLVSGQIMVSWPCHVTHGSASP